MLPQVQQIILQIIVHKYHLKRMQIDKQVPILIAGNYRGQAQPIRTLFYYLDVQFIELHLSRKNELQQIQKKHLIPEGAQLNCTQMPYLIHQGIVINDVIAILFYLCKKYQRHDLLGKDKLHKAHMYQLVQRIARKKNQKFGIIMQMLQNVKANPQKANQFKLIALWKMKNQGQSFEVIVSQVSKGGFFYFGYITIIDFLFFDGAFYFCNITANLDFFPDVFKFVKGFKENFEAQQWYVKKKEVSESFKVVFPEFPEDLHAIFKQIWAGDPKYF